jgi:hypothetical protein
VDFRGRFPWGGLKAITERADLKALTPQHVRCELDQGSGARNDKRQSGFRCSTDTPGLAEFKELCRTGESAARALFPYSTFRRRRAGRATTSTGGRRFRSGTPSTMYSIVVPRAFFSASKARSLIFSEYPVSQADTAALVTPHIFANSVCESPLALRKARILVAIVSKGGPAIQVTVPQRE